MFNGSVLLATGMLALGMHTAASGAVAPQRAVTARDKVAKIYGAGGLGRIEAYQSGVLISTEGLILTANSLVLDDDNVTVVLASGRRYAGEVLGADPVASVAIVRIEPAGESLPAFDLGRFKVPEQGDRVYALANAFGIAAGDEPVSLMRGTLAAIAPLRAWRGRKQRIDGDMVYVLDAVTSNPGAAGGALVDNRGRLVGMLGAELRSRDTGAWLSYAIPVDQLRPIVERILAGHGSAGAAYDREASLPVDLLARYGMRLTPEIVPRTPPYVDYIAADSPAAIAGLQLDDLVVSAEGFVTGSVGELRRIVNQHDAEAALNMLVQRDGEFIEIRIEPSERQSR